MENLLHVCATADTVTLWWDKPESAGPVGPYTVFWDGQKAADVSCTHFTATGLRPEKEYRAEVFWGRETIGTLTVRTARRLVRLDVRRFGAVGDGKTADTAALQKAIDACGPSEEVYFPVGTYLTGALKLHSDMALYLDAGAVLQGSADPADYLPRIRSRFEGAEMECYQSLLNLGDLDHTAGPNCRNVLLYGKGSIRGGGYDLAWRTIESERERTQDYLAANAALVAACENEDTLPGRVRGRLVNMSNCENIRITGLTLADGASWNVHMIYSAGIVTDHCKFYSDGVWNGDGWDPDSSEDCTLFASEFYTEDDSVAIKSGKNPEGNVIARPARHIRVFDCRSAFGHGICIGSEISGGIEDVRIWDCDLTHSQSGVEIKGTKKRGGYVRDVTVRDCTIPRVLIHSVGYNDDGEPAPKPPVFEKYRFERIRLLGRYQDSHGEKAYHDCAAVEIEGFDLPGYEVRDVLFRDITMPAGKESVKLARCSGVRFEGVTCG